MTFNKNFFASSYITDDKWGNKKITIDIISLEDLIEEAKSRGSATITFYLAKSKAGKDYIYYLSKGKTNIQEKSEEGSDEELPF